LGAFLSGGIDSAAITGLMARLGSTPVKTFSIGFENEDYDELRYARLIASRFGTDHHEFIVRPDAAAVFPELAWHYGEPFADGSAIATYYLAKMTRQSVTVALTGDGGDENFAGYERYIPNLVPTPYGRLPGAIRRPLDRAAGAIAARARFAAVDRMKRFWAEQAEPRERRYARWMAHFEPSLKADVCRPEFLEAAGGDAQDVLLDDFRSSDGPDFLDRTLDVDVRHYLPDDLLVKVDIATMAHGLEARSPFLDHVFMEFAASLPSTLKLKGTVKKYILKRALEGLLPDEIINRRKRGVAVPLAHWFRGELKEMVHDVLLDRRAASRGYFNTPAIIRLLDDHTEGRRSNQNQLFNLLMLELWHRTFIDASPVTARAAQAWPTTVS
jgi:asparagine synthase (glutamine-hydrolysing)